MTGKSAEELSLATNAAMDLLGYSYDMIQSRTMFVKNFASFFEKMYTKTFLFLQLEAIFTGSRGEGIGKSQESDIDIMMVIRDFLCLDRAEKENGICIIQTISTNSPPGYTKLNPIEIDSNIAATVLFESIAEYDLCRGQIFLSSQCLRNFVDISHNTMGHFINYQGIERKIQMQQGPSVPFTLHFKVPFFSHLNLTFEADFVVGFPYLSTNILESWNNRDRIWPPQFVCQEILQAESFVVPVGLVKSENQDFEWRISFTIAERILVSNLSPVMIKVYILFKMINKIMIKPHCDVLSSYMIKNVIFWITEGIDQITCRCPARITDILLHAFAFLHKCLKSRFLPNYLMQERNLLLGNEKVRNITRLHDIISAIMEKGGSVVMDIEKVKNSALYIERHLIDAKRFTKLRDRFEVIFSRIFMDAFTKLSPENMYQSSFLFDVMFEIYKEPYYMEFLCLLLKFLNLDFCSVACNQELVVKALMEMF